ncbi:MAG TPA: neutral/alkaline non-lysosomal ceramidase N-terminal domain-containing protein [Microthrixaceae bacterium]|nr:neutral/alkaline non-lysosomal ceramidase N-terminal domain-containing protein [Microthrixaceae bacterium]
MDQVLAPFVGLTRGRARFGLDVAEPAPLPDQPVLLAGAAEVDITPPPGLPKAGYSAGAHDGAGFRTRLRARVLHLRHGTTSMAWIACDLLGGSSVVQHLVALAIADRTDIAIDGLMMGATHTHAGPGQFLGSDFYNRFASNRSGFDPRWTQFLVDRIASAVVEAYDTRRPARAAFGTTEVWGWTRNRSLDPHVHNETVADKRTDAQRKWVSINPDLHLLRVDEASGDAAPISAMVVFSVHGTGISMRSREYNADLWAYLVGELSRRIEMDAGRHRGAARGADIGRCVVGAVEGTHADVAPAIRPGRAGHVEAQRVGRGVGAEAHALWARLGGELRDDVELGVGLREVDLEREPSIDGITLPARPAVGASLVAGATENTTPVIHRIPPFKAGVPNRFARRSPQGAKWVIGSRWLQPVVVPTRSFPRIIAVQALRIGHAIVIGLPFEITTETGRRIAAAVESATEGDGVDQAIVASVTNEYIGYIATAEEYERQFYEGGHTLYGPDSQRFVAAHAAQLAGKVACDGLVHEPRSRREWDLRIASFWPAATGAVPDRAFSGAPTFTDPTADEDGYWEAIWRDAAPGDLDWHAPLVRVHRLERDGTAGATSTDDQGWAIEVRHLGKDPDAGASGAHRYAARWYSPEHRVGLRHRFVLVANRDQPQVEGPDLD